MEQGLWPLSTTCYFLLDKKLLIHFKTLPWIPNEAINVKQCQMFFESPNRLATSIEYPS